MTKLAHGVLAVLIVGCHAREASPPPAGAPPAASAGPVDQQLADTASSLKSARYALEPPHNRAQERDASTVPSMDASYVTPEWVMLQMAPMQEIAGNTAVPSTQRAEANVLAARGEGILIEHFTTLFWNKAEPGRRVIAALQAALDLDPHNEDAAIAYTFSLLGIRNSAFRSRAEETMGVQTSRELARVAPLLAQHGDSLLAQSVLREVLSALENDGPLPAEAAQLRTGLDQHIATLRARAPDEAEEVDEQVKRYAK